MKYIFCNLVLSRASSGPNNCFNPWRHTSDQVLANLLRYFLPNLWCTLPILCCTSCVVRIFTQLPFQVLPEVFNGVEIWGLCRPKEVSPILLCEALGGQISLGKLGGVLWIIVLQALPMSCSSKPWCFHCHVWLLAKPFWGQCQMLVSWDPS